MKLKQIGEWRVVTDTTKLINTPMNHHNVPDMLEELTPGIYYVLGESAYILKISRPELKDIVPDPTSIDIINL